MSKRNADLDSSCIVVIVIIAIIVFLVNKVLSGVGVLALLVGAVIIFFVRKYDKKLIENKEEEERQKRLAILAKRKNITWEEYCHRCEDGSIFDLWFEWIPTGKSKQELKYKSLWDKDDMSVNYAPNIAEFNRNDVEQGGIINYLGRHIYLVNDVVYNEWGEKIVNLQPSSYMSLRFPVSTARIYLHDSIYETYYGEYKKYYKLKDNTVFMEIDYSSETLEEMEGTIIPQLRTKQANIERQLIEKEKNKLRVRANRDGLKKQALNELVEEGELFPEAGKRPPIPKDVVDAVWERDGGRCVYCGSTTNLQLDHIIPFSKGGATTVENLQLLCQDCNLKKSNHIGK